MRTRRKRIYKMYLLKSKNILTCFALLFLINTHFHLGAQEVMAIKAAKIITGVSDDIEGGVLLVKNGKILAVGGKDLQIPFDAKIHHFPRGVVSPGFIECNSRSGLRASNEYLPSVPYISVIDGIDSSSKSFANCLRDGITTIHVIPGNSTRIGGQGAVLKSHGSTVESMVIKTPSAMKISLLSASKDSRMTHMASLRRSFLDLYNYLEGLLPSKPGEPIAQGEAGQSDLTSLLLPKPDWKSFDFDKIPEDKIDPQKKPLVDLIRGTIPAFIYCPRAADVFKAFELMDVHGVSGTLVLGPDTFMAADALATREGLGPVVLDPQLEILKQDPDTGKKRRYFTAKILHDAGIRFAVSARQPSHYDSSSRWIFSKEGSYHLWYQAAILIRQGVPRDEALRSITLNAAEILELDHRVGSLEKGKDANFSVFTGDPLDARSWVDGVFIEGKQVYKRDQDRELKEVLRKSQKGF